MARRLLLSAAMSSVDASVQNRARSDAELAFSVMRLLVIARLLWSRGGALPVELLAVIADAPLDEVRRAVAMLCAEGAAVLAPDGVRLSERAARDVLRGAATASDLAAGQERRPGG